MPKTANSIAAGKTKSVWGNPRKEPTANGESEQPALEYAESIINTVREPLIVLDQDLRVVKASRSFYDVFKVEPEETIGRLIYDLGNKQWDIPRLRELLETILPQQVAFDDYEVEHDFATIGRRVMLLNARQVERALGKERIILLSIEDVTERRKYEERHNQLAAIVESADDAIIGRDLDGTIVSWNSGAEHVYGYRAEEIIGKSISLLMPAGHFDDDKALLEKRASGLLINNFETQRRKKNGQIVDVSLTISPITDISGRLVGASTIAHDITDRKEIENGLEIARRELAATKMAEDEARDYAESIIDTVREPLLALDQNLRVVTVSRSFYEVFRVNPEETVGKLVYDLGNKQWDIPKLRELLETILPERATFDDYEVEHEFATIGRRVMLLNARQIQRVRGKERIILLAIEDITERKEIEAGLEKTRNELAAIKRLADEVGEFAESVINTVREPLLALDQDLRVVKVSRSFYDFFKVNPEETVGQLVYDLGNKQWDIPKLRELLETILPESATFDDYEVEHDFATIGRRVMLLNARQVDGGSDKNRIILLAIEDITERKEAEESLKKSNEELEAFAYSVSHDLRAPLRGIDGWSLALLEDYKDRLDEKGREYIDLVRSETQIMGRLIDDLLTFSRQSRGEMSKQPLDMTAMAEDIVARLQEQNPTLHAEFIVQPGLTALGDPGLIEIALKNLLDNAAKFSGKRPRAVIEFGQVDQGGRKAFFVRDNGVGFDMNYAHKVFGVFQRLHKASEFPGTGIGLASVQRIVNRHGGSVWVEAKVGEGATFYFTLKEAS